MRTKTQTYTVTILALTILFAVATPAFSQQYFETLFNSKSGHGFVDSTVIFNGRITNLRDQQTDIVWRKSLNVPADDWHVEICQLSVTCWPWPIDSDTIRLTENQVDTIQVKFLVRTPGVGEVNLSLIAVDNANAREDITILFDAWPLSIGRENGRDGSARLQWLESGTRQARFLLPTATQVKMGLFDLRGRRIASVWNGFAVGGSNSIQLSGFSNLSSGVYLLRLETGDFGVISKEISILR